MYWKSYTLQNTYEEVQEKFQQILLNYKWSYTIDQHFDLHSPHITATQMRFFAQLCIRASCSAKMSSGHYRSTIKYGLSHTRHRCISIAAATTSVRRIPLHTHCNPLRKCQIWYKSVACREEWHQSNIDRHHHNKHKMKVSE